MTQETLKEYLEIIVDMEKDIFLKERLEESYKRQISSLGHEHPPRTPSREKPSYNNYPGRTIVNLSVLATIPLAIIIGVSFHSWIAGIVALIICLTIPSLYEQFAVQKKSRQEYNARVAEYQELAAADTARVQKERIIKRYLENEVTNLQAHLENSRNKLMQFYSMNIIFPKYRNYVMVTSIYEYICAGRCAALEGADGAYNLLELEIRLDHIITRLDRIIAQLDQIKDNQYMLYAAIGEANRKLDQLNISIQQIGSSLSNYHGDLSSVNAHIEELQKTSAVSAYFAERTQKELAYMNRINYLTGRNDGVFWNVPPSF